MPTAGYQMLDIEKSSWCHAN